MRLGFVMSRVLFFFIVTGPNPSFSDGDTRTLRTCCLVILRMWSLVMCSKCVTFIIFRRHMWWNPSILLFMLAVLFQFSPDYMSRAHVTFGMISLVRIWYSAF